MDASAPAVVDSVLAIPIADIFEGQRLRPVDPVWAAALGAIMAFEGQKTPIEVCRLPGRKGYQLVTGAHRLRGATLQGEKTIKAMIVSADALERRAREVSENLWRKGLEPLDRAAFVAELHELLRIKAGIDPAKLGRSISADVRWQKALKQDAADATDNMSVAYGFTAEVGERLGLTDRTIRRDLALHRRLLPDVVRQLRGHSLSGNGAQLAALTKLSDDDQRQVVALIVAGNAKSVSDGHAIITQKVSPSPETKAWSAFFGNWDRLHTQQSHALRELARRPLPKGFAITYQGEEL